MKGRVPFIGSDFEILFLWFIYLSHLFTFFFTLVCPFLHQVHKNSIWHVCLAQSLFVINYYRGHLRHWMHHDYHEYRPTSLYLQCLFSAAPRDTFPTLRDAGVWRCERSKAVFSKHHLSLSLLAFFPYFITASNRSFLFASILFIHLGRLNIHKLVSDL